MTLKLQNTYQVVGNVYSYQAPWKHGLPRGSNPFWWRNVSLNTCEPQIGLFSYSSSPLSFQCNISWWALILSNNFVNFGYTFHDVLLYCCLKRFFLHLVWGLLWFYGPLITSHGEVGLSADRSKSSTAATTDCKASLFPPHQAIPLLKYPSFHHPNFFNSLCYRRC